MGVDDTCEATYDFLHSFRATEETEHRVGRLSRREDKTRGAFLMKEEGHSL